MSYQVLSLKYRPQYFDDVVGQDHVTVTLKNAFKKDRVAQAYMFTGPRGVGKTTSARIVAKALNCMKSPGNPCNTCSNCIEITDGRNMDVLEIDGASNRGIEEIRNLRELIKFSPINAPYKVFIIDEVHMLTTPAFNALLRTLEEPPEHGKFILATTDIHKVPSTIISRCQRFDFNRINSETISKRIESILKKEKITIDIESKKIISSKADGSMRDALSLLDQVIAFSGNSISFDKTAEVLGIIPTELYFKIIDAIADKSGQRLMDSLSEVRSSGMSITDITVGLNEHLRNLLVASLSTGMETLELSDDLINKYKESAKMWDIRNLLRMTQYLSDLELLIKRANQPNILFELTLLKFLELDSIVSIEDLLKSFPENQSIPPNFRSPQSSTSAEHVKKETELIKSKSAIVENKKEEITDSTKQDKKVKLGAHPTKTDIQSKWLELVQAVSKVRKSIGNILEHGSVDHVQDNKVSITINNQPKFNLGLLDRNRTIIEDQLETIFKVHLFVKFSLGEIEQAPKIVEKKVESIKKEKIDPASKIIEIFDGEILR